MLRNYRTEPSLQRVFFLSRSIHGLCRGNYLLLSATPTQVVFSVGRIQIQAARKVLDHMQLLRTRLSARQWQKAEKELLTHIERQMILEELLLS